MFGLASIVSDWSLMWYICSVMYSRFSEEEGEEFVGDDDEDDDEMDEDEIMTGGEEVSWIF